MHRAGAERDTMMANPRAAALMQKARRNPRVMKALEDVKQNGPGVMAKYANDPEVMEVVNELQSIRQERGSQPADGIGRMPTGLFLPGTQNSGARSPSKSSESSPPRQTTLGGALGSHKGRAPAARGDVDALLRKAEGGVTGLGGGKASVGYSRAKGSSGIFM